MSRRLLYVSVAAVAGLLAVRRATQTAQHSTSAGLQQRLSASLGSFGESLGEFLAEVQVAMAERERELRTTLGLDGTHDVVDAGL